MISNFYLLVQKISMTFLESIRPSSNSIKNKQKEVISHQSISWQGIKIWKNNLSIQSPSRQISTPSWGSSQNTRPENMHLPYSFDIKIHIQYNIHSSILLEPHHIHNQITNQPQKYCNYHIADTVRLCHHLSSFLHPLLVLLKFFIVVLDLVKVDQYFLVDVVDTLTDIDSIIVQQFDSIKNAVHSFLNHSINPLQSLKNLPLFNSLLVFRLKESINLRILSFEFLKWLVLVVIKISFSPFHFPTFFFH